MVVGEAESAPEAREFMESHGIEVEVVNLDLAEPKELLAEFIRRQPGSGTSFWPSATWTSSDDLGR